VVVKSTSGLLWGILGLLAFAGILMVSVFIYKRNRAKENIQTQTLEKKEEINP
jgi:hypothetical protein